MLLNIYIDILQKLQEHSSMMFVFGDCIIHTAIQERIQCLLWTPVHSSVLSPTGLPFLNESLGHTCTCNLPNQETNFPILQ